MARGGAARLFVAIDPPPEVGEELAEWARQAVADWSSWAVRPQRRPRRAPRVLKAEALHLTLCFLGSRPAAEIATLSSALATCAEGAGSRVLADELSVGAPLWLPPRRPHALAVELHDRTGGLAALQASVGRALSEGSGWEPERRRFRPHITLVRMRAGTAPARGATGDRPLLPPTPQLRFTPESIVLYRSLPAAGGTAYDPLETCVLGPAAG
jgi:RNA 2',3'-cyclic 3'-phosphodiesterase